MIEVLSKGSHVMKELLTLIAVLVGWFVLNAWVLPKFGIKT